MATTFDENERSASQNRPIDLYLIVTPTVTYRLTSHVVDVSYGGSTYTALTMSRGNLQVAPDLTGRELTIYLPTTHALVQRYLATGVPEHEVLVTKLRLQEKSGQAIQQWSGFGCGMSVDGHIAMLRVPSITDDAMKIRLPVIAAQRLCNHVLYDVLCTVDRISATGSDKVITAISGNTVTTNSLASGSHYVYGDIVHVTTQQRRMVVAQSGSVLTLNVPFVGAVLGDFVSISPGCDHSITTCRDKFSNVINYGGCPDLNATINPWAPKGIGVIQQT